MQINSCKIADNLYIQVYLTGEEVKTRETNELINRYKEKTSNVAVFVTGKENYPEILNKIIVKQLELSNNVC